MAAQSVACLLPPSPNSCCITWLCAASSSGYPSSTCGARRKGFAHPRACRGKNEDTVLGHMGVGRREVGILGLGVLGGTALENACATAEFTDMPALRGKDYGKTKMRYPDYTETESGLQYKDLRAGLGSVPQAGDIVVVDWDGYTIGYYGRIFEARNKAKGGSFEGNEKEFFKFRLGWNEVIPAFEEAVATMRVGGVRRILVPPELGYPDNDFGKKGPRPTTFSGQRALDFVLRNQGLIDKTLLFDIELLKVSPQV